jgi:diacylglycerol kinase family enzyme
MKHLFIVNPKAFFLKGCVDEVCTDIRLFFANYPEIQYDIHITRWKRDAAGFTRRYVSAVDVIVRVYAVGGMSTLMEVINGVVGMPNVQAAAWPFGIDNAFLHNFGKDRMRRFSSLRNLVFSEVSSFDLIRCGNNFGICASFIGLESLAAQVGDRLRVNIEPLPGWIVRSGWLYIFSALYYAFKSGTVKTYQIVIDGTPLHGDYINILIANQPYLGNGLHPALEARPNDGLLDIYLVRFARGIKFIPLALDYVKGRYHKWPGYISHYRGKNVTVSSEKIMEICLDGEHFYDTVVEYEVVPYALDFAFPHGQENFMDKRQ